MDQRKVGWNQGVGCFGLKGTYWAAGRVKDWLGRCLRIQLLLYTPCLLP